MSIPGDETLVSLSGELTTPCAEETHRRLAAALAGGSAVRIDVSGATEVDVSLLQLLAAAQRTAAGAGQRIALAAPPQGVVAEALARCGFAPPAGATALSEILAARA